MNLYMAHTHIFIVCDLIYYRNQIYDLLLIKLKIFVLNKKKFLQTSFKIFSKLKMKDIYVHI